MYREHAMSELSPLEEQFPRLIPEITALWDSPSCYQHLLSLLIDHRGARRGFPEQVHDDLALLLALTPRPIGPYDIWTEAIDAQE
jgi:hypothetical protein